MKSLKKPVAILFAVIMFISVLTGCAKRELSNITTAAPEITTMKSETTSIKVDSTAESKIDAKVRKIIQFGSYEQDNNTDNGKEKINWYVLLVKNGKALLLSEKILDCKPYNETNTDVTWETCTLRTWLNNDFYNSAFSSAEQARIVKSNVVNENNPWFGIVGGNNTNDKIFLLSFSEAMNTAYGFSSDYSNFDTARRAQGTDFAINNGLDVYNGDIPYVGNSSWWLRSPGYDLDCAGFIGPMGYVNGNIGDGVFCAVVGVRPALWLKL